MINRNSLITRWDSGKDIVTGTFDSHDFGMKWSYAEMAVAIEGLGLEWALNDLDDCLRNSSVWLGIGATKPPTGVDAGGRR